MVGIHVEKTVATQHNGTVRRNCRSRRISDGLTPNFLPRGKSVNASVCVANKDTERRPRKADRTNVVVSWQLCELFVGRNLPDDDFASFRGLVGGSLCTRSEHRSIIRKLHASYWRSDCQLADDAVGLHICDGNHSALASRRHETTVWRECDGVYTFSASGPQHWDPFFPSDTIEINCSIRHSYADFVFRIKRLCST